MKKALIILSILIISSPCFADQWVNGYTRQNGTYVQGYTRTEPNNTKFDNYSFRESISIPRNNNSYNNSYGQYDSNSSSRPFRPIYGNGSRNTFGN